MSSCRTRNYKDIEDFKGVDHLYINPKFNKDWIIDHRFNKINYAQPIIPINYSSYKIPIDLPINGLYCANTAQIYPEDRGTNYSVELGEKVSKLIMEGNK